MYEHPLSETVYMLGAGFNRALTTARDGASDTRPDWMREWAAPLNLDLFQCVQRIDWLWDRFRGPDLDQLLAYVEHFFGLTKADLAVRTVDLEECFTLLELQGEDAVRLHDQQGLALIEQLQRGLVALLATYLSEFSMRGSVSAKEWSDDRAEPRESVAERFAKTLLRNDATVLTFNYDTILEGLLERASGYVSDYDRFEKSWRDQVDVDDHLSVPDEVAAFANSAWERELAYGFRLSGFRVRNSGAMPRLPGSRFYALPGKELYPPRLLKLHGSVNWFRYGPSSQWSNRAELWDKQRESAHAVSSIDTTDIVMQDYSWYDLKGTNDHDFQVEPIVIPPILSKRFGREPYIGLWDSAARALRACDTLVVIGYSFPPTDVPVRRLLRETFADHQPSRIIVVNPDGGASAGSLTDLLGPKRRREVEPRTTMHELDSDLLMNAPQFSFDDPTQPDAVRASMARDWMSLRQDTREALMQRDMADSDAWWNQPWSPPWPSR